MQMHQRIKGDGSHQIFWLAHLSLWNERSPLLLQVWVIVQDLLRESSEHISRRNAVDSDISMSPLNRQTRSQMSNSRLRSIVRCLRLWNVDNSSRHATNEDHASRRLSLHQVLRDGDSKQVCSIHVDTPQFSYSLNWVVDCLEVLCESCRCDQVVDLAMLRDDLGNGGFDGFLGRYIGVMGCDFGNFICSWVLLYESCDQLLCLLLCLLLVQIHNSHICTTDNHSLTHNQTQTTSSLHRG